MSGHSKWSQIKHKKSVTDQKKGKIFGKLAKAILLAAKDNPDPKVNLKLKSAIEQAREMNMPNENVDRLLRRISDRSEAQLYELVLEALGPGGIAFLVSVITDNKNRTVTELRLLLSKNDGRLADEGSVSWMFKKMGSIRASTAPLPLQARADIQLQLLEFAVQDISEDGDELVILTKPEDLSSVRTSVEKTGLRVLSAEFDYIPSTKVPVADPLLREKLDRLYTALDDHDDVQEIYSNEQ